MNSDIFCWGIFWPVREKGKRKKGKRKNMGFMS